MITSVTNNTIKSLIKLKQKKYRDLEKRYLIEGEHLVKEALIKNKVECLISTKPIMSDKEVILVSDNVMEKLAMTKTPQTIMAKCIIDDDSSIVIGNRYLILDDLQDPGNIGTLIRSAIAFKIDQVILSNNCVDLYNDKLLRAMQGANFHISCIYQDLEQAIKKLQDNNVMVVGSALEGGIPIEAIERFDNMAIVVGNEGNGMNKELLKLCDHIAYIPIDTIESLNAAIAGSIMMYKFR